MNMITPEDKRIHCSPRQSSESVSASCHASTLKARDIAAEKAFLTQAKWFLEG
jgi:hypothetical protein